jgi:hypothetical protein
MTEFPIGMFTVLALIGVHVMWVLLPLIPAVLIYWMFPNTPVAVSGPLAGLTVKTGGAFGAYLVVLLLTYAQLDKINQSIGALGSQFWTVKAQVDLVAGPGEEPFKYADLVRKSEVETTPPWHMFNEYEVTLRIMEDRNGELPIAVIKIPNFGQQRIDWNAGKKYPFERIIKLTKPLKFRQQTSTSAPVAAAPARLESASSDNSTHPAAW